MWQAKEQNGKWIVTNGERTIILSATKQPMTFDSQDKARAFADIQNAADRRHGLMR